MKQPSVRLCRSYETRSGGREEEEEEEDEEEEEEREEEEKRRRRRRITLSDSAELFTRQRLVFLSLLPLLSSLVPSPFLTSPLTFSFCPFFLTSSPHLCSPVLHPSSPLPSSPCFSPYLLSYP